MIKYIGSKRLLIEPIAAAVLGFGGVESALDLFSGTSRVGQALKSRGLKVTANDHLTYAATIARCYVEVDAERYLAPAERILGELSRSAPVEGYVTHAFCQQARYFQPHNGRRIDGIRDAIAKLDLEPRLESIALTALMEAADRVDSTTGVQMAYLKQWAKRSYNDLQLRLPILLPGEGKALQLEAAEAAKTEVDVAYLDPPYNQHSYKGNYHVWETLVRNDAPESYGIANKRMDCRTYKNAFNSKPRIGPAFQETLDNVAAKHIVVSFSNEGYLSEEQLVGMLSARGHVRMVSADYKRYVGAQIGIHNKQGQKVGKVSHLRNKELLFLVSPDLQAVERAEKAAQAALGSGASAAPTSSK